MEEGFRELGVSVTSIEGIVASTQPLLGLRITGVQRWLFSVREGIWDDTIGPMEISFEDGTTLTLEAGRNSQSVVVSSRPIASGWPVEALERVVRVDVSNDGPYKAILGGHLTRVVLWENEVHYVTAVQLVTDVGELSFLAECDQARVRRSPGDGYQVFEVVS